MDGKVRALGKASTASLLNNLGGQEKWLKKRVKKPAGGDKKGLKELKG